jgi:hypothetical protein
MWPLEGNNLRRFEADRQLLHLRCDGTGLAALGHTAAPRYELAATFSQTPWVGGVGLFFGYGERVIDGQPVLGYQTVEFHPDEPKNGFPQARLSWRVFRHVGPPGGECPTRTYYYGEGPSFSQAVGAKRLGLAVGPKGLESVTLDGKTYPAADITATDAAGNTIIRLSRAEFDGEFGVIVFGGHGTVEDVKFIYHEVDR